MASSTALVQLGARELGLTPYTGDGAAVGEPVERRLERLRQDRVNFNQGYDPLIQLPDGRDRPAELGYERVKTGPTSNFVGNHMTQGAIDLVQAHLEQPARGALLLGAGAGAAPHLPRLLSSTESDAAAAAVAAAAVPRPLHQYCWLDAGSSVRVEVPVDQMQLGRTAACASVTCSIQADRLDLLICATPEPAAEEDTSHGTHSTAPDYSSAPASGAAGACHHRLLLHPLHAAVVPASCRCYVKGLPALPPGLQGHGGDSAEQPAAAAAAPPNQGSSQAATSFALPPGATHIVIELCKVDAQLEWPALLASRALSAAAPGSGSSAAAQPDVVALRRALRQKLSRAAAPPADSAGAAAPTDTPPDSERSAEAGATFSPAEAQASCQAALLRAEELVAAGQHAEALAATSPCLPLLPTLSVGDASLALQLRALRGHCQAQLGCLKLAVAEYGAAIRAAQGVSDTRGGAVAVATSPSMLAQLLLARAALYEQQEQLQDALADAQQAANLRLEQAPAQALAAQAAERLRRACRQASRM
ncbi:hypothetical protein COHA_009380 [Chlorella ohadii]|uniref:Uncharacterized protein n=1 Tax=Chlorella ohadii TaxID=2649997 RepID=A0AAD5DFJ3_9CHLO|nr:hypothetical protein COHA_009380 [Chlorella ohadii]